MQIYLIFLPFCHLAGFVSFLFRLLLKKIAFFRDFSCIFPKKALPLQRLIRNLSRNNHVLLTKHIR